MHKKLETIGMNNALHLELLIFQLFARSLFKNRKMQTKSVYLKKRTRVISQSILNELNTFKNKLWCFRKPHEVCLEIVYKSAKHTLKYSINSSTVVRFLTKICELINAIRLQYIIAVLSIRDDEEIGLVCAKNRDCFF